MSEVISSVLLQQPVLNLSAVTLDFTLLCSVVVMKNCFVFGGVDIKLRIPIGCYF